MLTINATVRVVTRAVFAVGLFATSYTVNAERVPEGSVSVSVSYDVSMERPEDEGMLDEALRRSREMVYSRIKLECAEMKRHIASTCELVSLNVSQSSRQAKRQKSNGSMVTRAKARFRIELSDSVAK